MFATTPLHWVAGIEPHRLALSARPRGGEDLAEEVAAWQAAGVDLVVSLLEASEVRELELMQEARLCAERSIAFRSFPIRDRSHPDATKPLAALVTELHDRLRAGQAVAIHCRAGIGRTGLVAACLLHRLGVAPGEVFHLLSRSRGLAMPDTEAQASWFERYARTTASPAADALPRTGTNVVLRRLRATDLAAFQAYRSDEAVGRYQGWSAQTDAQALAFIASMREAPLFPAGDWVQLAIADRGTDELVGDLGIFVSADRRSAEIGFTVSPRFQQRGLGREALLAAIGPVFEREPVEEIVCITDARNNASTRLLERAGLDRVATQEAVFRGAPCLEHTYKTVRPARSE
jgi:RimJ/RimL family protein N-acetyltransferase/protein-tyrosine phosphatase